MQEYRASFEDEEQRFKKAMDIAVLPAAALAQKQVCEYLLLLLQWFQQVRECTMDAKLSKYIVSVVGMASTEISEIAGSGYRVAEDPRAG